MIFFFPFVLCENSEGSCSPSKRPQTINMCKNVKFVRQKKNNAIKKAHLESRLCNKCTYYFKWHNNEQCGMSISQSIPYLHSGLQAAKVNMNYISHFTGVLTKPLNNTGEIYCRCEARPPPGGDSVQARNTSPKCRLHMRTITFSFEFTVWDSELYIGNCREESFNLCLRVLRR